MVLNQLAQKVKPEERDLRENLPLAWNSCAQHMVEGGDAIRGDQQQGISNRIEIAHLASSKQRNFAQIGCEQSCHRKAFHRRKTKPRFSGAGHGLSMRRESEMRQTCRGIWCKINFH